LDSSGCIRAWLRAASIDISHGYACFGVLAIPEWLDAGEVPPYFSAIFELLKKKLSEFGLPYGFLDRYRKNTRPMRRNILIKNLKSPFIHHPWLRKAVMRSCVGSMRVIERQPPPTSVARRQ